MTAPSGDSYSIMTPNPRTPEARLAKREMITMHEVRRVIARAIEPYLSIKCREGDHLVDDPVFGSGGCANDGTSCLCECHDRLGAKK